MSSVRRHDIAAIWVAFFSRCQRYRCGQVRTVRSFSREEMEIGRYSDRIETSYQLGVTLAKGYGSFLAVMFGLSQSAVALVLYAGGSFVISGHLSVGQLASFLLYVVFVAASLGMLTSVYGDFMKAVGASARVFELLERCAASYLVTAFSTV